MTTVYDDVAFGPRNYKLDEKEVEDRVMKSLDMVGISHLKDKAPYKLSEEKSGLRQLQRFCQCSRTYLLWMSPLQVLTPDPGEGNGAS